MKLYHETNAQNVQSILTGGFIELGDDVRPGISVADRPPRLGRGPTIVIHSDLATVQLEPYAYNVHQWTANGYREWRVPAAVLNTFARTVIAR